MEGADVIDDGHINSEPIRLDVDKSLAFRGVYGMFRSIAEHPRAGFAAADQGVKDDFVAIGRDFGDAARVRPYQFPAREPSVMT